MSKLDRIKAEISFHEKMFFVALAVILALTSWAFENYLTIDLWVLVLIMIGLFCSIAFGAWNYKQIKMLLRELENAE
jgi:uncharacterized membrane protein YfcA